MDKVILMGAQRVKSFELSAEDIKRIEEHEEAEGVEIPPHMIPDVARQLAAAAFTETVQVQSE